MQSIKDITDLKSVTGKQSTSLQDEAKTERAKGFANLRSWSEDKLTEKGFVYTKLFGWLNPAEATWLDEKLKANGITTPLIELDEMPAQTRTIIKGKNAEDVVVVAPFITEFHQLQKDHVFNDSRYAEIGF